LSLAWLDQPEETTDEGTAQAPVEMVLSGDNVKIAADAKIKPGRYEINDIDDNGAVQISGNGITVDFQGAELVGMPETRTPDTYMGKGIVITGKDVRVRNAKVRGFKLGVYAHDAPGLVVEHLDVSGNFRERLKSTSRREDGGDWLSPHHNDKHQWVSNYGAGLCVERSDRVTVRNVRARQVQNGIILDRVHDSWIYDNDCSFLSGWGLAMWRSSRNLICRNALDFCVRGYSHGTYNRGQDSAGILMFEQNNSNIIAENSATHCGDGLFGFGGVESLAGTGRTGNNGNLIVNNDFSYAAAHGIEMTFSFDNQIVGNRLTECAICGIWAGYSQDTLIGGNILERNGDAGYGSERGGVNIEHGRGNVIKYNTFGGNECGVFLWSDEDKHLANEPWVKANERGSTGNLIAYNQFQGDKLAVQLRQSPDTTLTGNVMWEVGKEVDADSASEPKVIPGRGEIWRLPQYPTKGEAIVIDARRHLNGRDRIVMSEWGPCDHAKIAVLPARALGAHRVVHQVVGPGGTFEVGEHSDAVRVSPMSGRIPGNFAVKLADNRAADYRVAVRTKGRKLTAHGTLLRADWQVRWFKWDAEHDPRSKPEKWKELLEGDALSSATVPAIDYYWGSSSPADKVPADRFATVATATLPLPAGKWRVRTISDDGVRVWLDGQRVIDNWTWHPPTEDIAVVELSGDTHPVRIEHFEIDGHAQLHFLVEPLRE
jgi:parallel beta-helix repeat protein